PAQRRAQGRLTTPPLRVPRRQGLHLQDLPGGRHTDLPLLGQGRQFTVQFHSEGQKIVPLVLQQGGVIPKCGHAALRLDCFLVDVCVTSSSSSSSSFNSARHSGGVQRQSVRRSLAIASRVCSTISSQRPDTTAARSWNTASALSSVQ